MSYDALSSSARQLITRKGLVLPLTRTTRGVHPETGDNTHKTETVGELACVCLPLAKSLTDADERLREASLRDAARYFLAAAYKAALVPLPGDTLTYKGRIWRLYGVTELAPDGTAIIYKLTTLET